MSMFMSLGIGAVNCKASTADRVVNKVDRRATQIVNGHFIHDDFNAIGFEGGIHITEIIIECHAEIHTAATAASNIDAQGISFEIAFRKNIADCVRGSF